MNWMGGARNRIKSKQEKRKQVEFFNQIRPDNEVARPEFLQEQQVKPKLLSKDQFFLKKPATSQIEDRTNKLLWQQPSNETFPRIKKRMLGRGGLLSSVGLGPSSSLHSSSLSRHYSQSIPSSNVSSSCSSASSANNQNSQLNAWCSELNKQHNIEDKMKKRVEMLNTASSKGDDGSSLETTRRASGDLPTLGELNLNSPLKKKSVTGAASSTGASFFKHKMAEPPPSLPPPPQPPTPQESAYRFNRHLVSDNESAHHRMHLVEDDNDDELMKEGSAVVRDDNCYSPEGEETIPGCFVVDGEEEAQLNMSHNDNDAESSLNCSSRLNSIDSILARNVELNESCNISNPEREFCHPGVDRFTLFSPKQCYLHNVPHDHLFHENKFKEKMAADYQKWIWPSMMEELNYIHPDNERPPTPAISSPVKDAGDATITGDKVLDSHQRRCCNISRSSSAEGRSGGIDSQSQISCSSISSLKDIRLEEERQRKSIVVDPDGSLFCRNCGTFQQPSPAHEQHRQPSHLDDSDSSSPFTPPNEKSDYSTQTWDLSKAWNSV